MGEVIHICVKRSNDPPRRVRRLWCVPGLAGAGHTALDAVAERQGASRAQTALAWVFARWDPTVVIPATRQTDRFLENLACQDVRLSPDDVEVLEQVFEPERVAGDRYADMSFVNR